MRKTFFLLTFLMSLTFSAQAADQYKVPSRFITVNPAMTLTKTNGLNVGILDDYHQKKINGINFQLNPLTLVYLMIPTGIDVPDELQANVEVNGLHLSTGGMTKGNKLNGVGISMYHIARETNGITLNGFNNSSGKLNGLHASILSNSTEKGNGILLAMTNDADQFNGLQLGLVNGVVTGAGLQVGIYNNTKRMKGVQVGVINKSESRKGLQIGFWNKNAKRTLPIINF